MPAGGDQKHRNTCGDSPWNNPPGWRSSAAPVSTRCPVWRRRQEIDADTPFGKPSAPIVVGELQGQRIAFLARHGIGHRLSPSEVPYRANIYALKALGVERIVSISACGSLREDYAPGEVVVPDQLFDFTRKRKSSFFEDGLVAHISVANPFCEDLSMKLFAAVQSTGAACHSGGSLITIEGPRFSTKAESNTYRSWGMSIIGMTASPEAFLAREAELCYAVMAHVTDYDVWHTSEEAGDRRDCHRDPAPQHPDRPGCCENAPQRAWGAARLRLRQRPGERPDHRSGVHYCRNPPASEPAHRQVSEIAALSRARLPAGAAF